MAPVSGHRTFQRCLPARLQQDLWFKANVQLTPQSHLREPAALLKFLDLRKRNVWRLCNWPNKIQFCFCLSCESRANLFQGLDIIWPIFVVQTKTQTWLLYIYSCSKISNYENNTSKLSVSRWKLPSHPSRSRQCRIVPSSRSQRSERVIDISMVLGSPRSTSKVV